MFGKKMVSVRTRKTTKPNPSQLPPDRIAEMIREKAYEIYCNRNCQPGDPLQDWLEAEKIVCSEVEHSA